MTMRILAIGDIHGCTIAFDSLIAAINLQPSDRIITLGDYIDRGPDSKGIIDRLLALHHTGRLVALRGNHEIVLLNLRATGNESWWREAGGAATLASYSKSGEEGHLADIPDNHWDFLEHKCINWYQTKNHFFVHAGAYPDMPLAEQPDYMLFWEPFDHPAPHISGKIMVCGHTIQKRGMPLNLRHAICIDTWAYGKGWLTCLDITSGRIWQANQKGNIRQAWLDEFLPD